MTDSSAYDGFIERLKVVGDAVVVPYPPDVAAELTRQSIDDARRAEAAYRARGGPIGEHDRLALSDAGDPALA